MAPHTSLGAAILAALPAVDALVMSNQMGKLPALGWSSWNAYGCSIDSDKIMTAAKQMVNLGFKDRGYEYVNIDDCWSVKSERNSTTKRLIPDTLRFPDGISGVASEIHDLGLKVGIYSSAGKETCAGYPASLGYEEVDAQSWAEWGIDFLKYDNCGIPDNWTDEYVHCVPGPPGPFDHSAKYPNGTCPDNDKPAPEGYDWSKSKTYERYRRMHEALQKAGRPILFSLCNWGDADVNTWGKELGSSWRMSFDITDTWSYISAIANMNSFMMNYVGFWGRPDPDMLEVGNGLLTIEENRAHFALWAIMKAPLIIGTDLGKLDEDHLAILKNEYLLDFNQDPEIGRPAYPYKWGYNQDYTFDAEHPAEYWSGPSSALDGTIVLMLNSEWLPATRTAAWSEIPELKEGDKFNVIDVWTGEDLGCVEDEYSVDLKSHDAAVLLVKGPC